MAHISKKIWKEFETYTEAFGLDDVRDGELEEQLEYILSNLETQNIELYKLLFKGYFAKISNWNSYVPISTERVLHSFENGLISYNDICFDRDNLLEYFTDADIFDEVKSILRKNNRPEYLKMINDIASGSRYLGNLDYEIASGDVKINKLPKYKILTLILKSLNPKLIFKLLTPAKKIAVSLLLAENTLGEDIIRLIKPEIKTYLINSIENNKINYFVSFSLDYLVNDHNNLLEFLCPIIKVGIEKFELKEEYPFNLPKFRKCLGRKEKKYGEYDFVGSPDVIGQRIVKKGYYFGVINEKGKLIVPLLYHSISVYRRDSGCRIAIRNHEVSFRKMAEKIDRRGRVVGVIEGK